MSIYVTVRCLLQTPENSSERTKQMRQIFPDKSKTLTQLNAVELSELTKSRPMNPIKRQGFISEHVTEEQPSIPNQILSTLKNGNNDDVGDRVYHLIVQWAKSDARAAYEWIVSQPEEIGVAHYLDKVIEIYTEQDIDGAGELIANQLDPQKKSYFAKLYVSQLSKISTPQDALNWAYRLTPQSISEQAQVVALESWAEVSPQELLFAEDLLSKLSQNTRKSLIDFASKSLTDDEPAAYAQDLYQFPEDVQASVAYNIAGKWSSYDSAEASAWIDSLDSGAIKDSATEGFVKFRGVDDPQNAFYLAEHAHDDALRMNLLKTTFQNWYSRDPSRAVMALEQSETLSRSERIALSALSN